MTDSSDLRPATAADLGKAVEAVTTRLDTLANTFVSRNEFEQLRALVVDLAKSVAQIVPTDEVPDEHLAIMSAVFAASIGKRFRIKRVQQVTARSSWAQAGRVNLHAQRHIRRP